MFQTNGLTTTEARSKLLEYGPNVLVLENTSNLLRKFFGQLFNILNLLLLIAAVVSLGIGDKIDALLILAIIILNASLTFWQEFKAERTLAELKKVSHTYTKVVRDGKTQSIDSDK